MLIVKNSNIKSVKAEIKVYHPLLRKKFAYSIYPSSFLYMYRDDDREIRIIFIYTVVSLILSDNLKVV